MQSSAQRHQNCIPFALPKLHFIRQGLLSALSQVSNLGILCSPATVSRFYAYFGAATGSQTRENITVTTCNRRHSDTKVSFRFVRARCPSMSVVERCNLGIWSLPRRNRRVLTRLCRHNHTYIFRPLPGCL
jgi:hypothetical protein